MVPDIPTPPQGGGGGGPAGGEGWRYLSVGELAVPSAASGLKFEDPFLCTSAACIVALVKQGLHHK